MSMPVKIAVAEPSLIICSGIVSVLKRLGTLHLEVFEINEADQFKNALAWQKPDILIIAPSMLGMYSLSQVRKDAGNPNLKCVALQNALSDTSTLKVYDQVISIYDSADQIKEKLVRLINEPPSAPRRESLSAREKEVIVCVIRGMTNKQIADTLCLSTHTIITHRRNISAKLGIHSTAGLTIYAIVNKLVELNDVKDIASEAGE